MTNKKFFAVSAAVLLACSGLFIYGKFTQVTAKENSTIVAKMRFAEEMDKKYAEESRSHPMVRSTINCEDLISQAFFAEGEVK